MGSHGQTRRTLRSSPHDNPLLQNRSQEALGASEDFSQRDLQALHRTPEDEWVTSGVEEFHEIQHRCPNAFRGEEVLFHLRPLRSIGRVRHFP